MSKTHTQPELLIVGASARAASQSAVAAGYQVTAIDLFGDADLRQMANVKVAKTWPAEIPSLAEELAGQKWMYTGALENHPDVIAEVSSRHSLCGCDAEAVRAVRDPVALYHAVTEAGFGMPETLLLAEGSGIPELPEGRGAWLCKPIRSAGGQGICRWKEHETSAVTSARAGGGFVLQEEVPGEPHGAVFVTSKNDCQLWGVTRQLIGRPEFGTAGFQYCGSLGPVRLSGAAKNQLRRLGQFVAERYRLRGLFGIDFVVAEDNTPWLIEINPRYTASAEVLERATGTSAVRLHLAACGADDSANGGLGAINQSNDAAEVIGKAILFARDSFTVSERASDKLLRLWKQRFVADVPPPGTVVMAGHPMFTIFAAALTVEQCRERLTRQAKDWFDEAHSWVDATASA